MATVTMTPAEIAEKAKAHESTAYVLPKGTPGAVGFLGGRLFFPL